MVEKENRWSLLGGGAQSQKIAEEAIRLIKNCPAAVTLARKADYQIVADSGQTEKLLKISKSRAGASLRPQWLSSQDFDDVMKRFDEQERLDGIEVRLQKNDGEQFWAAISARKIEISDQPFLFLYINDLTEHLSSKAEISRQRDALHDAEKLSALGQLLGGISHELNNPLSVLSGQALMLKEKASDESTAKRADRILNAANRCSRIVRSFLDLAKSKPPDLIAVDLNELVAEAAEETAGAVREIGAEMILELPENLPRVLAEPDQIRQVFINLLLNALHALRDSKRHRRITIQSKPDPARSQVRILFSDTGSGIPPEVSSRIFDPLFTTKSPGEGTGIGLALCRRILDAHGGTIELRETSSFGTTFQITLGGEADAGSIPDPILMRAPSGRDGASVLIMNNRIDEGNAIADMISKDGHGVELVEAAFVGFERLRRSKFDAIFLRVGFGEMSVKEILGSIDEARRGSGNAVAFIIDKDVDRATLRYIEQLERPYLTAPVSQREIIEVLDLLTLRMAA